MRMPFYQLALTALVVVFGCDAEQTNNVGDHADVTGTWNVEALAFDTGRVREIPEEDGLTDGIVSIRATLSGTILLGYLDGGREEEEWTLVLTDEGDGQYHLRSTGGYADMDMRCSQVGALMDCMDTGESDWASMDPYNWLRELYLARPLSESTESR